MEMLTDDLLTEVLIKLPIKLLLQFKSVSKSWLALISSHRFAKSHLPTSLVAARDDDLTLIAHLLNNYGSFALFSLDYGQIVKNLQFPYSLDEYYPFVPQFSELVGCDSGILCVSVDVSDWPAAINKTDIYLWNPTTKHSKRIPTHTLLDDENMTQVGLGFGFDHIDLDFKVVRVARLNISAEVFSSNKNTWRKIEPNPTDIPDHHNLNFSVCLHGFLFCIGCNGMMAFHLNKEVFVCDIKLPCYIKLPDDSLDVRVTDFNDTVAVFMYDELDENVKLWTLNDEACLRGGGVEASWTMMLNINVGVRLAFVEALFDSVEFLLHENDGGRFLYNYIHKETIYVPYDPLFETWEVFKYTESLFSIPGSKCVKWSASSSWLEDESDSSEESIPD